jgi:hypothetical protein
MLHEAWSQADGATIEVDTSYIKNSLAKLIGTSKPKVMESILSSLEMYHLLGIFYIIDQ